MDLVYNIGLVLFGLAGTLLAGYIARQKNNQKHLTCPIGHSCDSIINGKYSKFFGARVEYIGLFYYLGITLFYGVNLFFTIPSNIVFVALLVTGISFLFAMHLLATQLFLIKKWCTLCIGSAAISFMILVMSFLGFTSSFGAYLFAYHDVLVWLFAAAVLVGVISSSLHAKTFIKFLRDFEVSEKESQRLSMFGHVGWVAITIASLSGLALVLTDEYGNITGGNEFTLMIMILGILIVYEVVVNMIIGPRLVGMHFDKNETVPEHKHMMMRKSAFAFLAIGVASWYSLLLLLTVSFYSYSILALIVGYVVLLLLVVVLALYVENLFYKKVRYADQIKEIKDQIKNKK